MKVVVCLAFVFCSGLLKAQPGWDTLEVFKGPEIEKTEVYFFAAFGANANITRALDPSGFLITGQSWLETSTQLGVELVTKKHQFFRLFYAFKRITYMPRLTEAQNNFVFWTWNNVNGIGLNYGRGLFFNRKKILDLGLSAGLGSVSYSIWGSNTALEVLASNVNRPIYNVSIKQRGIFPYIGMVAKRSFHVRKGWYFTLQYGFHQGLLNLYKADFNYLGTNEKVRIRSRGTHFEALMGFKFRPSQL